MCDLVHISDQGPQGALGRGGVSRSEEDEEPGAEHGGEDTRNGGTTGHCQQVSSPCVPVAMEPWGGRRKVHI